MGIVRIARWTVAIAVAAAFGLACFGRGPGPSYFTLSSGSGEAAGAPVGSWPDLGLVVGPIEFPRYLDRPELVMRDGSHRLVIADAHRWGGSLGNDLPRVVADDLGRLLGTSRVAVYPSEPRFDARYRILLDIREFEGVLGESATLRARWTIAGAADGRALAVEESKLVEPVASASHADLVAAESAALGSLARRIAERVAELQAHEAPDA